MTIQYQSQAERIRALEVALQAALVENAQLKAQVEAASELIKDGLDIMSDDQVGQWHGVRAWLEQPATDYGDDQLAEDRLVYQQDRDAEVHRAARE